MASIRNKAELLLAVLFAGEDPKSPSQRSTPVVGITRLEKLLFLSKVAGGFLSNVSEEEDFHFVPFRMGPWSQEVYDEVDFLESLGLLRKDVKGKASPADAAHDDELFSEMILDKYQANSIPSEDETETFELSEAGRKRALEIWSRLSDEERTWLIRLKSQFNRMSLKQFLRYVYKKYPRFTTESEIKDYLGIKE